MTARLLLVAYTTAFFFGCGDDVPSGPGPLAGDTVAYDPAWVAWVQENAHAIASVTSEDYSDLQFLKPILAGRRLVQLGESSHGVSEYNSIKVRLIKFLHEEMGFGVIAFESSMLNCYLANENAQSLSRTAFMEQSISGVWRTEEALALFAYIKETHLTPRPLILAGFDLTRWHHYRHPPDSLFIGQVVASIDSLYAQDVFAFEARYSQAEATFPHESVPMSEWAQLRTEYSRLVEFFDEHMQELLQGFEDNPTVPMMARQGAWSTARMTEFWLTADYDTGFLLRDSTMADNVSFLLEDAYPDEKVIVWAHNVHISNNGDEILAADGSSPWLHTMGEWLVERHRQDLYTVGLHAYRGTANLNDRSPYGFIAGDGTVEGFLHKSGPPNMFVDLLNAAESDSTEWMFQLRKVLNWHVQIQMVVRDQYDAILLIDEVHPPSYVN